MQTRENNNPSQAHPLATANQKLQQNGMKQKPVARTTALGMRVEEGRQRTGSRGRHSREGVDMPSRPNTS